MAHTLKLEYVPLDDLAPATANPKRHDHARLGASVNRFGFMEPVLEDGRTGRLVGGHGRCDELAMRRAAGDEPPPGITIRKKDGVWLVPVVRGWASKDDDDAEAALVALNRIGEAGGWDPRGLADMLNRASSTELGLEGTGYTPNDLTALLASVAEPEPPIEFPTPDDNPTLAHRCPRCSFEFD